MHPEAVVSTDAMDIPAMLECAAQGVLGHFTEVPVISEENLFKDASPLVLIWLGVGESLILV